VKIAPQYGGTTVHVHDASRAVNVVASLLDPKQRQKFDADNRGDQDKIRRLYRHKDAKLLPYAEALANRVPLVWRTADVPQPAWLGRRVVDDVSLDEIATYIDWTFFFHAWELKGKFPKILDDPKHGEAARDLYQHGQAMLRRIIDEKLLGHRGVYGFWPAESDADDIVVWSDAARQREATRFHMLRQQEVQPDGKPNRSLADFVAPRGAGVSDHVGAFAVTTGIGARELAAEFERRHDDYGSIMVKALADRLAEAFAEWLHRRVRREWGYGTGEDLSLDDLIRERYRGIRPAFGYPACPDHSEKLALFELLEAPALGIELTETFAMFPAASVSGMYFAHPEARYFTVGKLGRDQVADYAGRKGVSVAEVERWLRPYLAYEPS
jgi:5-methyltetrahydrofolate--homocysteine methyltransferase